jgi:SAM-dependent methyltransferase
MSTFAKPTFNASVYSASRPTYPLKLFEYIFSFHGQGGSSNIKPRWERAVDLGCGTGQATEQLKSFQEVIGIDPSLVMLHKARASIAGSSTADTKFRFIQGSAEDFSLQPESVDLIAGAQSAHWFDWSKVWPQTYRVLRHGGTAAFWVYAEFRLTNHPALTPLITAYAQGSSLHTSLGPHFQRPGRTILERHLVDVPEPSSILKNDGLEKLHRAFFCGDDIPSFIPPNASTQPIIMRKEMTWRDLLAYFRTWSSLHTFHERFPEDKTSAEDTRFLEADLASIESGADDVRGGDIAIRFWKDLRENVLKEAPEAKVGAKDSVLVEWPLALILTRKV